MRILIMGLSGSGKTTFAKKMVAAMRNVEWLNADMGRTGIDVRFEAGSNCLGAAPGNHRVEKSVAASPSQIVFAETEP